MRFSDLLTQGGPRIRFGLRPGSREEIAVGEMYTKSTPSSDAHPRSPRIGNAEGRRRLTLLSALLVFLSATAAASFQGFRSDPCRAPRMILSAGWWQERLEQNAMRRLPEIQGNILGIALVPGTSRLWICGTDGLLLFSEDGGRTWESPSLPADSFRTDSPPSSAKYLDPQESPKKPPDTGQMGPVPPSDPRGPELKLPEEAKNTSRPALQAIRFSSTSDGWVVGDGGIILHTRDGGKTWSRKSAGKRLNLHAIHFPDGKKVWFAADTGILEIPEGAFGAAEMEGRMLSVGPFPVRVQCIHSGAGKTAAVVGGSAWFLESSKASWRMTGPWTCNLWSVDGSGTGDLFAGKSTQGTDGNLVRFTGTAPGMLQVYQVANYDGEQLFAACFPDRDNFWLAGAKGRILHSADGGATWTAQHSATTVNLNGIAFADGKRGWIVGNSGTILATEDGGTTWHPLSTPKTTGVFFGRADGRNSWTIAGGRLVRTQDGTQTVVMPSAFTSSPVSIHFIDPDKGWVWLKNGEVAETDDAGRSWSMLGPHRPWFSPWYLLTFLPVIFLLHRGWQKPPPAAVLEASVADLAVSDRPIGPDDPDPLRFGELARGISRFLRNENTEPPVTVAITGAWGTGKSSLMNLLKADLGLFGFKPVWFNAWHHQNEENLLAAVLQAIRLEATPHIFSPMGLPFRLKLLGLRIYREWFRYLSISAVFALSLGYLIAYPDQILAIAGSVFQSAAQDGGFWNDPLEFLFKALGPSLGVFGGAGFLLKGLRAFGLNPADLLASKTGNTKMSALEAQTAFRIRFAREFNDVAVALRPKTLTLFIDDLDRCSPENVLKLLEAVNFLVSSGPCTVVMGLDLNYVKGAVVNVLEKQMNSQFADRYLEKLVNLEVPVPTPTNDQLDKFMGSTLDPRGSIEEPSGPPRWFKAAQISIVAGLSLSILAGAVFLGSRLPPPPEKPVTPPPPEHEIIVRYLPTPETAPPPAAVREDRSPSNDPSRYIPCPPSTIGFGWLYLLLLPLGVAAAAGFFLEGDVEVRDSGRFKEALKVWNPLLIRDPSNPAVRATPRSMKRFLNRVRYLAMMQRRSPPLPQPLIRFLRMILREKPRAPEDYLAQNAMAEETLVALSMIRYCNKSWAAGLPAHADFIKFATPLTTPEELSRLATAVNESRWRDMAANLERFAGISAAVRLA
jgi:photosystem II stability/assembly factor-like uncharacterized protein